MLERFRQVMTFRPRSASVWRLYSTSWEQTYIQRNGDLYEYLTDEEKDVEEDQGTEVESTDILKELESLLSMVSSSSARSTTTPGTTPTPARWMTAR